MKNRKVATINNSGTLTVKVGPRNEDWTLQGMTENFSTSEEWKQSKKSLYKIPNVELRSSKEFAPYESLDTLEQKMWQKYRVKINEVLILYIIFLL